MPNLFWALMKSPHAQGATIPHSLPRLRSGANQAVESLRMTAGQLEDTGNAFKQETMLDEVAFRADIDPIDLRRRLMSPYPAAIRLLEAVEIASGWKEMPPPGSARGFAFKHAEGTWVATVVELAEAAAGLRVDRIICTADPGYVRDEHGYCAALASAVRDTLSAALGPAAEESPAEPEIAVELIRGPFHGSGTGRIVAPPVGPALANAVFALTGRRVRSLPVGDEVFFV